jgi:tRNA(His) guanylyltransferase
MMRFDDLDTQMRVFETAHDHCVLPGIHMVARLDGRGFTRLTKEVHNFEAPFDIRFRNLMVKTVQHLFDCGFHVVYGYTESDEISLLFHIEETAFNRKVRKYNSILAGEASAKFSLEIGALAVFDCRICQLPQPNHVIDYFRWRQADAHRNALNAHCYWQLRKECLAAQKATQELLHLSVSAKNELLFARGINFNDLPAWQKRGIGLYWEAYEKVGLNPLTGQSATAMRRRVHVDYDLPMKDEYDALLRILA